MVSTTLVGFDIEAGRKVVAALAGSGVDLCLALWAKVDAYDEPRIFLASPDFDKLSKLDAYGRIEEVVEPQFAWSAPSIVILPSSDPFVDSLRVIFGDTSSVEGMRLGGQTFGNRYLEDAYVYVIR